MISRHLGWLALPLIVVAASTSVASAIGLDAQRIVVRSSVELLPEPLAGLFREHLADLQERVVEPDTVWLRDGRMRDRRSWHRAAIDVAAADSSREARLAAGRNFPTVKADAKRLYSRLDKRGGNGTLPWAIAELYDELVEAFRAGDRAQIIRQAAYLAHFAADATDPFHASVNYDGKSSHNLHLGRVSLGHPDYQHRNVAVRFLDELVRRNRGRFADQVQLSPGDYDPVDEPVGRARSVLLASLAVIDEVTEADAEIVKLMEVSTGRQLRDRADVYYQLLDERCGAICVDRLRHGAIFAANLIGGAWTAAGKPALRAGGRSGSAEVVPEKSADRDTGADPQADPPETPKLSAKSIVGSARSNIYHYWRCRHARKIAPENLVAFESTRDAKAEGRRACRVCKPPA